MQTKIIFRISFILFAAILVLYGSLWVLLQGGLWVTKLGVIPVRARLAAQEIQTNHSNLNIRIKEFSVRAKEKGLFKKGGEFEVSCVLENDSEANISNFKSLMRTPKKELASEKTKILKKGESVKLTGTFVPEEAGQIIIACRADVDQKINESSENDNREIAAIYVQ